MIRRERETVNLNVVLFHKVYELWMNILIVCAYTLNICVCGCRIELTFKRDLWLILIIVKILNYKHTSSDRFCHNRSSFPALLFISTWPLPFIFHNKIWPFTLFVFLWADLLSALLKITSWRGCWRHCTDEFVSLTDSDSGSALPSIFIKSCILSLYENCIYWNLLNLLQHQTQDEM